MRNNGPRHRHYTETAVYLVFYRELNAIGGPLLAVRSWTVRAGDGRRGNGRDRSSSRVGVDGRWVGRVRNPDATGLMMAAVGASFHYRRKLARCEPPHYDVGETGQLLDALKGPVQPMTGRVEHQLGRTRQAVAMRGDAPTEAVLHSCLIRLANVLRPGFHKFAAAFPTGHSLRKPVRRRCRPDATGMPRRLHGRRRSRPHQSRNELLIPWTVVSMPTLAGSLLSIQRGISPPVWRGNTSGLPSE